MTILRHNLGQNSPQAQVSMGVLSNQVLKAKEGVDGVLGKMKNDLLEKKRKIEEIAVICEESRFAMIEIYTKPLRETGDINIKKGIGNDRTLLMDIAYYVNTAYHEQFIKILKLLLSHPNSLVNEKNNDGDTALMISLNQGNLEIAEFLLNHNSIQVNEKNNDGYTALILAIINRKERAIIQILNHPDLDLRQYDQGKQALNWGIDEGIRTLLITKMREQGIEF